MKELIVTIIFLAVLLIASHSDYQDQVQTDKRYCAMVNDGVWPDYKGVYGDVCHD